MIVTREKWPAKIGEDQHITVLSDAHIDSSTFCEAEFRSLVKNRNKLPNHRWIVLGDFAGLILSSDQKRYTNSTRRVHLGDDEIDQLMDWYEKELGQLNKIDMIVMGNHEHAAMKHHHTSVTARLCRRLGVRHGGYSGWRNYIVTNNGVKSALPVIYHHGAWGGSSTKGYTGFSRWLRTKEDWRVAITGHNHQAVHHMETHHRIYNGNKIVRENKHIVVCGTYQASSLDGADYPQYGEIRGYPEASIGSPLIAFSLERRAVNKKRSAYIDVRCTL